MKATKDQVDFVHCNNCDNEAIGFYQTQKGAEFNLCQSCKEAFELGQANPDAAFCGSHDDSEENKDDYDSSTYDWYGDDSPKSKLKHITVTWSEVSGEGRLVARCDDDHTLSSNVVRWSEPINARSDSLAIATAVTEINGSKIISVDHDKEYVHVAVES